ncbi:hypothetical protein A1OS_17310 [Enterovibrio norvegicus]|uniref:hypothetical protein n=1 Tax=Enterovibrio norvegicus TaxID=188144 RepID=UPI0003816099|nr:hypothetical protein [Enterovibrio norvegicus]OEE63236.1 hypothetical protein A1OS_17310 [Enterovibrio norvegicus]
MIAVIYVYLKNETLSFLMVFKEELIRDLWVIVNKRMSVLWGFYEISGRKVLGKYGVWDMTLKAVVPLFFNKMLFFNHHSTMWSK